MALIVILVVIIAVVAPVVLAALMYVMVLGFGGSSLDETPVVQMMRMSVGDGVKLILTTPTKDVQWAEVNFEITGGGGLVSWIPFDWANQGTSTFFKGGPSFIGSVLVWYNMTDITGDGQIDQGDYFTITNGYPYEFLPTDLYSVSLIYLPTNGVMCTSTMYL